MNSIQLVVMSLLLRKKNTDSQKNDCRPESCHGALENAKGNAGNAQFFKDIRHTFQAMVVFHAVSVGAILPHNIFAANRCGDSIVFNKTTSSPPTGVEGAGGRKGGGAVARMATAGGSGRRRSPSAGKRICQKLSRPFRHPPLRGQSCFCFFAAYTPMAKATSAIPKTPGQTLFIVRPEPRAPGRHAA